MALQKVTMQDIADSCGLSRNTVSKIFNGRGAVPDSTRRMVLERARELGYRRLPDVEEDHGDTSEPRAQSIALFSRHMPSDHHFGISFVSAIASYLVRAGYTLTMYELTEYEFDHLLLPDHFSLEQTAGILGIELFSKPYLDMICEQGLPTVFIDTYAGANLSVSKYDLVIMENIASSIALTDHMIAMGAKTVGFVGDGNHCNSFHERWTGYMIALDKAGLVCDRAICILDEDGHCYSDPEWYLEKLQAMPYLPDGFVCANDFIALRLMVALKQLGIPIPKRVMVSGFDGTSQSAFVEPSLTTAKIPGSEIGQLAAEILLDRIENPDRAYRTTYVNTIPQYRASTAR